MPEQEKLYDTELLIKTHDADEEFVKYMISVFLKHMPESNEKLVKASNESDWVNVHFYAHKMKASIDLFELKSLKELIRSIDAKAKTLTDTNTIAADVTIVSEYIQKCMAQMKEDFNLQ